jgi:hypothetical protein
MTELVAPLTGSCLCGAVGFTVSGPLTGARYCHCRRCQHRTGTAFSVSGLTDAGSFAISTGAEHVTSYAPEDGGWVKSFCERCGSHLYTSDPADSGSIAVRFGALDQDPGIRPSLHQFVDYAAPWDAIPDDGLPRHPERAPWG